MNTENNSHSNLSEMNSAFSAGHVAQDLREWIEAAGYNVVVTGGGRIDYRKAERLAVVYGFSYGFGKGDHAKVAALISEWSEGAIEACCDYSEGLY